MFSIADYIKKKYWLPCYDKILNESSSDLEKAIAVVLTVSAVKTYLDKKEKTERIVKELVESAKFIPFKQ